MSRVGIGSFGGLSPIGLPTNKGGVSTREKE